MPWIPPLYMLSGRLPPIHQHQMEHQQLCDIPTNRQLLYEINNDPGEILARVAHNCRIHWEAKLNEDQKSQNKEKENEVSVWWDSLLVVVPADTFAHPGTMVILADDADVALLAVEGVRGTVQQAGWAQLYIGCAVADWRDDHSLKHMPIFGDSRYFVVVAKILD